MKRRRGFTLLEMMIVTVILGILAMVASIPIRQVRERAFISSIKQEVKNAVRAAAMYHAVNEEFPEEIGDLSDYYVPGGGAQFCVWTVTDGASPALDVIQIEAVHRGAETGVTTSYPTNNGVLTEKKMPNCVPLSTKKKSAKKKRRNR
jgi:prepilin-type N-terminal cleavage/methylation domain-containing protein